MTQTPATAVQRDYGSVLLSPVVMLTWLTKGSGAMCWRLLSVQVSIRPSLDGVARLRASILVSVARTHRVMPHRSRDASFTCSRALHRPSLALQAMGIYVPTTGVEGVKVDLGARRDDQASGMEVCNIPLVCAAHVKHVIW